MDLQGKQQLKAMEQTEQARVKEMGDLKHLSDQTALGKGNTQESEPTHEATRKVLPAVPRSGWKKQEQKLFLTIPL